MGEKLTIITKENLPLAVRIGYHSQLNNMIKPGEIRYVQALLQYLHENSFETYVGGSTLENMLFAKRREAEDIDLLAVGALPLSGIREVGGEKELVIKEYKGLLTTQPNDITFKLEET
ncbi:MAG: hypothetical protein V1645_05270, partial [archaeon]